MLNHTKILAIFTLCILIVACSSKQNPEVQSVIPVVGNEACIVRYMDKIDFVKNYGQYSIEKFSITLESHKQVTGELRLSPFKKNSDSIKYVINGVLDECYPQNLAVGKFDTGHWSELESAIHMMELESTIGKVRNATIFIEADPIKGSFSVYQ